ncbi:hypothetical protein [Flavobacterium agrisoli]|uniref:Universal stress protein family protein n=1 Tax=Flavobacterium agrisoli TaxID=2793066 RepID=A0A934PPQ5_9FLAO|nr:hypothetical protein [Flavobacterium agrisoli]MBK0370326.1 hypothetical protein [Flavobacterium agrisoli]
MKNYLIPTQLHYDTLSAIKTAIVHGQNQEIKIVLLWVSEEINAISAAHFLREFNSQITSKEQKIVDTCLEYAERFPNCSIEFKRQFGLSSSLLKKLLHQFETDLIVLTSSMVNSKKRFHSTLIQYLEKQKTPILHLNNAVDNPLTNAVFLQNKESEINLKKLENYLNTHFPFQKISQIIEKESHQNKDTGSELANILSTNAIDFVIETRKKERLKLKKASKTNINQHLNIPVLSLYEEMLLQ